MPTKSRKINEFAKKYNAVRFIVTVPYYVTGYKDGGGFYQSPTLTNFEVSTRNGRKYVRGFDVERGVHRFFYVDRIVPGTIVPFNIKTEGQI